MLIAIAGFLADSSKDNSVKLRINVKPEFERTVMDLMGWEHLEIGHWEPLISSRAQQISAVINEAISTDLNLSIGVRFSDEEVAERHKNTVKVIFLSISGFYLDSNPDDSLKYDMDVPQELESKVLAAMGWASIQHVPPGEHILTTDQVTAVMKILGDPVRNDLVYYIGACVKRIPLPS